MRTDCAAEAAAVLAGTTADVVGLLKVAPRRAAVFANPIKQKSIPTSFRLRIIYKIFFHIVLVLYFT